MRSSQLPDSEDKLGSAEQAIAELRRQFMRTRTRVAVVGLLLVIFSAGVGAALARGSHMKVVVVVRDLPADAIVSLNDVALRSLPSRAVPRHSLTRTTTAVGLRLLGPIARGDALSQERFATNRTPSNALHMTITVDAATASTIARGDRVDVWCASPPDGINSQRTVRQTARALRVVSVSSAAGTLDTAAVLVAVPPADVPALIATQAEGAALLITRRP